MGKDDNSFAPDYETGTQEPKTKASETNQYHFRTNLKAVLSDIEQMLIAKNEAYGNAALEPLNVFCKLPASQRIRARIDEKISRIMNNAQGEDSVMDLIGYLILLRIEEAENKTK